MTIQPKKNKLKHGEFADFKLESDADEVYIPDHIMSDAEYHKGGFREKYAFAHGQAAGIGGYQKYLHVCGKVIVDNTDQFEPNMPNFSNFLPDDEIVEEEEAVETKTKFAFSGLDFKEYIKAI